MSSTTEKFDYEIRFQRLWFARSTITRRKYKILQCSSRIIFRISKSLIKKIYDPAINMKTSTRIFSIRG